MLVNLTAGADTFSAEPGALLSTDLQGLRAVADTLDGPGQGPSAALPDPWSQLSSFQIAFADERHPGHWEAVSQWRGLLALLGLSGAYDGVYTLDVQAISLGDAGLPASFQAALSRPPELTLLPGLALDEGVSLITVSSQRGQAGGVRGHPVGIVSPTALVAPAASAVSAPGGLAPFLEDGLRDPLNTNVRSRLRSAHWRILTAYLRQLEHAAAPLRAAEGRSLAWRAAAEALAAQLSRFADECEAAASTEVELTPFQQTPRRWPVDVVLGQLDATFRAVQEAGASDAQLRVKPSDEGDNAESDPHFRDVYWVEPSLARTLEREPADVLVWENTTLAALETPDEFAEHCALALQQDALLLRPQDIFTAQAVRMESAMADGHGRDGARWVLPLTPAALFVLDIDAIDDQLSIEEGDHPAYGRYARFTLRLTLTSGVTHETHHLYAERPESARNLPDAAGVVTPVGALLTLDGEDEYNAPDAFAVWPNFVSPDWRHNFLYFQADARLDLSPVSGVSRALTSATVRAVTTPRERLRVLRSWSDPEGGALVQQMDGDPLTILPCPDEPHAPWLERLRFHDDGEIIGEIHRMRSLDAIAMARPCPERGRRYVGLVLLRRSDPPAIEDRRALVSVDFGTTGTVAQLRVDGAYEDIVLQARVVRPTHNHEAGETLDTLSAADITALDAFFPLSDIDSPAPTVALIRTLKGPASDLAAGAFGFDEMGFTHMAYFEDDLARTLDHARHGRLAYGLKWGVGKRPVAKRFLRQLILMIAAQMRAQGMRPETATWCFSYPEAFTSAERSSFKKVAVQAALNEVFGADVVKPVLYSESMAFIEHFSDITFAGVHGDDDAILGLDIGGGSCDAVLSSSGRLVWRNSFPIGGQTFFTDIVRRHPEFLQGIFAGDARAKRIVAAIRDTDPNNGEDAERARGLVEAMLATPEFKERFEKFYPLMWDEGPALRLRCCAAAALGGLLWYLGGVIEGLVAQEKLGRKTADRMALAFGGRGSGLFRLMHEGADGPSHLSAICSLLLYAGDHETVDFDPARIRLTQYVKREVALGMLKHADAHRAAPGSELSTPAQLHHAPLLADVTIGAGESATAHPPHAEARGLLIGGALRPDTPIAVDASMHFDAFLNALRFATGLEVALTDTGRAAWMQTVAERTRTQLRNAPPRLSEQNAHYIEPPFITGLHLLLGWLSEPEDAATEGAAKLTVRALEA